MELSDEEVEVLVVSAICTAHTAISNLYGKGPVELLAAVAKARTHLERAESIAVAYDLVKVEGPR